MDHETSARFSRRVRQPQDQAEHHWEPEVNQILTNKFLNRSIGLETASTPLRGVAVASRTVIVSNRVPSPNEKAATAGGLAVALADAASPGSLWFGWSGKRAPETASTAEIAVSDGVTYATIDIGERDYTRFYNGFANGALWPLFHFRAGLLMFNRADYEAYRAVNLAFARALVPLLKPDDLIWIHDYQLLTMAAELRALGVTNRIGFFMHIPFVPPALLEVLPPAAELLAGLSACDVVGFQTERDRLAFLDCIEAFLNIRADRAGKFNYDNHTVQAVLTPIGIDAQKFAQLAKRAERTGDALRLDESLGDRALVLGVDRLDYSKGLPQRFDAFGRLLYAFPQHLRQVNFLQIAARSRQEVGSYQTLRRELDRRAGDINGEFSDFDWVPLRYMTHAVKRNAIAGFYRRARVGLVTPLRDGMNLVAKEYVAAQDSENPGVLVLSRFAGAADELTEALIVNPFDPDEVAEAIHQALTMPLEERQERHARLRAKVWHTTAARFCETFLDFLRNLKKS
jgi:trehalose 6-phosphate synthase